MILAGLALSRLAHLWTLLILLGCGLFPLYTDQSTRALRRIRPVAIAAGFTALVSGFFWFAFTAAGMSGSLHGAIDWPTLTLVANSTSFGHVWIVRLLLVAAACLLLGAAEPGLPRWRLAVMAAGVALASTAWAGHGQTGEGAGGVLHAISDVMHLFAAAVWIGALAGLLLLIRQAAPAPEIGSALTGFSGLGTFTVALLGVTGVVNSWFLIGPQHIVSGWTTPYGATLLAKLALFCGMFALATVNRFRLTPRLTAAQSATAKVDALHALKRSITAEIVLALLVIAAVGLMGTLPPPSAL